MRKLLGWIILLAGIWMFISPQALVGLDQFRWMHAYAFKGEILVAIVAVSVASYLLDFQPVRRKGGDR